MPLAAAAQERPPGAVSGPGQGQEAELRRELDVLRGRVDELGIELQRQERMLGALMAKPDAGVAGAATASSALGAGAEPSGSELVPRVPTPAAAPGSHPARTDQRGETPSTAAALIVMVGNDGALTLEGRPAALPTLGFALRATAGGDMTRRVVVGAEPKASAAQVGEVVSAVSQSGFGRITITGP